LPRPIIKSHPEEKEGVDSRGAPKNLAFSYNIYAMAESIDFKMVHTLGGQLGPSYTNDKSRPRSRHGTFSTKLRILFNIFAMAEVAMDVPNKRYYIEKLQIFM